MTKASTYNDLADKVEAASGPDLQLDGMIAVAFGQFQSVKHFPSGTFVYRYEGAQEQVAPRYTASIDAALALVPEGWAWSGEFSDYNYANCWPDVPEYNGTPFEGRATTPALALVAASLRAHAEEQTQ